MSNSRVMKVCLALTLLSLILSGYLLTRVNALQPATASATSTASPMPSVLQPGSSAGGPPSLAPMLKTVLPAVVNIEITAKVPLQAPQAGTAPRDFHGAPEDGDGAAGAAPDEGDEPGEQVAHGIGSGVIIDAKAGYIVTNNHVVDDADTIKVKLKDDREFDAELVGKDAESDLAILRIKADNLTQLSLADSDRVQVGDYVVAIGSPFALNQTVTAGIVSAVGRDTPDGAEGIQDFIQTDASINPGNSGGALVNLSGELVAIPSQILSRSGGNLGIGFAIPTNLVKSVMKQLIAHGKVVRGKLGLGLQELNPDLVKAFGLKDTHGALITQVEPGSTGAQAGIQPRDVVLAADAHDILNIQQFHNYVATLSVGDHVTLKLLREGKPIERVVEVGKAPEKLVTADGKVMQSKLAGTVLSEVTDGKRRGLLVSAIDSRSLPARAGVRPGDVIVAIDSQPVSDLAALNTFLSTRKDQKLLLQLQREGRLLFLALQ